MVKKFLEKALLLIVFLIFISIMGYALSNTDFVNKVLPKSDIKTIDGCDFKFTYDKGFCVQKTNKNELCTDNGCFQGGHTGGWAKYIIFLEKGSYDLGFNIKDYQCNGVNTGFDVFIDNTRIKGWIGFGDNIFKTVYGFRLEALEDKEYEIKIQFHRDAYNPPECDLNLYLDYIEIKKNLK